MGNLNFKSASFILILVSLLDQSFAHIISEDLSLYRKEYQEIAYLYDGPMLDLEKILNETLKKCKRFPSEKEFKEFILNGSHPDIKCSEKIMIRESSVGSRNSKIDLTTGKNIQKLALFLENKKYKVLSDTQKIHVILDFNPSDWKFKASKYEDFERIISCATNHGNCLSESFDTRAISCRNRKESAELYCHLGGKKIIDY